MYKKNHLPASQIWTGWQIGDKDVLSGFILFLITVAGIYCINPLNVEFFVHTWFYRELVNSIMFTRKLGFHFNNKGKLKWESRKTNLLRLNSLLLLSTIEKILIYKSKDLTTTHPFTERPYQNFKNNLWRLLLALNIYYSFNFLKNKVVTYFTFFVCFA